MAESRPLTTLRLNQKVKDKLNKAKLKTVKDVLSVSMLDLAEMTNMSNDQCKQLTNQLFLTCCPQRRTALDLLERDLKNAIRLGSDQLDALLHGGLQLGTISEFVGPCGVGKTQLCIHIAINSVLPKQNGGHNKSVIYVDLENTYRCERVTEILANKFPHVNVDVPEILSKIHVFRPSSVDDFSNLINSLEDYAIENEVGLLIIDSIASLVRREIATTSRRSIFKRGNLQVNWMANLKRLAQGLDISVILTNQVATESRVKDRSNNIDDQKDEGNSSLQDNSKSSGYHLIPALGYKWSFYINTRFILQYTTTTKREMIIAKSPVSPFSTFYFTIGICGISFEVSGSTYSNAGCNPGNFKMKAQKGISI